MATETPIAPTPAAAKSAQIADKIAKARAAAARPSGVGVARLLSKGRQKLAGRGGTPPGTFALKKLVIARADNIGPDDEIVDRAKCRELCVPLAMEEQHYPTIQADEVVMETYEVPYDSEVTRNHVLSQQRDPYWYPGRKRPDKPAIEWPAELGFGVADPTQANNQSEYAGKANWVANKE